MKILLTGYPGFLGNHIKSYFDTSGHQVDTIGILATCDDINNNHIVCDLSKNVPELHNKKYDLVIHAAGKAHVTPKTETEKKQFFDVNVQGTSNLLQGLVENPPDSIILISTVAVYGKEKGVRISENDSLEAIDPYGLSKLKAEELILNYNFPQPVCRGIVRLPLVAGPSAPGNLGSMLRAMEKGIYFNIGQGNTKRSVILYSDIAPFLELLSKRGGIYNLTDGDDISFKELYHGIRELIKCPRRPPMPKFLAFPLALGFEILQKITSRNLMFGLKRYQQLTHDLTFDGSRAIKDFNYTPQPVLKNLNQLIN